MDVNQELLKSLNGAIETAIQQLISVDQLAKSDVSLQDAKLRPESANGTLPGDNREDSTLKPEDAKKAEDEAAKGENPFADKDGDGKDDEGEKKEKKKSKKDSDDDEDDDGDMDDDKAEKMKAKIKKYEDDKAAKAASAGAMVKSEAEVSEELKKSIVASVTEAMAKSFGDRLSQLEGLIEKIAKAPQPRQSTSGLAPLAKSAEDVGQPAQPAFNKATALDQLFDLQKSGDKRVDSGVIARVEMGDYSALAERGINLK